MISIHKVALRKCSQRHTSFFACSSIPRSFDVCYVRNVSRKRGQDGNGSTEECSAAIGAVVGNRYVLRRLLGRGAAACVFAAEHVVVRRPAAIKLAHPTSTWREYLYARLRRETDALARVRYPAVVDVIDAGEIDGVPYLVMSLLEGRTLSGLVAARGRLEPDEVVKVGAEVAFGLAAVHRAGIVHRDVKPGNVIVTAGVTNQVRLYDFGTAKFQDEPTDSKITRSGAPVGKPEYMAPEFLAAGDTDHRGDIYSLGVTLYECLTGSVPFEGEPEDILTELAMTGVPSVLDRRPETPRALAQVVQQCLSGDPEQRFASAYELGMALAYCAAQPLETVDVLRTVRPSPRGPVGPEATGQPRVDPRRAHFRAPYATLACIDREDATPGDAKIEDISEGGVLALTRETVSMGERVRLRFVLPASGRITDVDALARWVRVHNHGRVVGFQFKEMDSDARADIREYVTTANW